MIKMYTFLGKAYSRAVCLKSEVRLSVKSVMATVSQPAHSCLSCIDDSQRVELEQDVVQDDKIQTLNLTDLACLVKIVWFKKI